MAAADTYTPDTPRVVLDPRDHEALHASIDAEYEKTVRADIERFRKEVEAHIAGATTVDQFRAVRLRRGIYSQRQAGVQMVRTKVPGGMLSASQMEALAAVADNHGGGKGHLTTRQNIQFHFVPLPQVPDLLHQLADARLTTREACYNTVRNVTCCPLAGLFPGEVFDPRPYARQAALAFLHKELTDNLPRKFKIAFTGYEDDTTAGAINDIGLKAVIREENGERRRGFRILAGGGLGPLPNEARLLDDFVPVERMVNRLEAVIRVFAKHGNRKNKNKARMKFIILERGFDWFRDQVEREYRDILENGGIEAAPVVPEGFGGYSSRPPAFGPGDELPVLNANGHADPEYDRWVQTNVRAQKQPGYAAVTVRIDQGNLTAAQMRALARLASDAGDGFLRLTVDQNVVVAFVETKNLKRVYAALKQTGLAGAGVHEIDDVLTCPGAYSCNLALTKSMNLGAALANATRGYDDPAVRALSIKVSGCPNSCGHHWIADIGFYGNARKIDGREVPYYLMLLGGGYDSTGVMRFGLAVQAVPARLAPEAARRVIEEYRARREGSESFRDFILRQRVEFFRELTSDLAKPAELFPEIYKDWGDDVDFSLQLGRGECMA
jgi:sulfite reductase beta subunit-like hemoprotein